MWPEAPAYGLSLAELFPPVLISYRLEAVGELESYFVIIVVEPLLGCANDDDSIFN